MKACQELLHQRRICFEVLKAGFRDRVLDSRYQCETAGPVDLGCLEFIDPLA